MSLTGLRVLSLESRRAAETAELIRRQDGEAMVAPSMREVPLERNPQALDFGRRLLDGDFDMVILMTGVGTRYLLRVLDHEFESEQIRSALGKLTTVARGPKPSAALREIGLIPTLIAPEPNTWKDVLAVTAGRKERRIAVQEYGRPSSELYSALRERGVDVTAVPVYQYELPEDLEPLREAVRRLAAKQVDVALFTSSIQIVHLMDIARSMNLEAETINGLQSAAIGSIGPTTSETLAELGLTPAFTPEHPKIGMLVREAAERAPQILASRG